ncbi:hypothetical protein P171DRAFT_496892 [Karstenula rhodostoma CBS 690.94]|uniref:Uncharacterized protein n=1 Tax=Karstenula rhodostoma CBS 690.94 TaxID=1392251 RepID=A0A9P4PFC5_9PLEO|nr:hypothetical protein P171DRAFT_496892 [Karstenula rhodostoma CBS 690.94]
MNEADNGSPTGTRPRLVRAHAAVFKQVPAPVAYPTRPHLHREVHLYNFSTFDPANSNTHAPSSHYRPTPATMPQKDSYLPYFLFFTATLASLHALICYISPRASLTPFRGPAAPTHSPLLAHIYGVLNATVAAIRAYAAYDTSNRAVYDLALGSFVGVVWLLGSEWVGGSVRAGDVVLPVVVSGVGVGWMVVARAHCGAGPCRVEVVRDAPSNEASPVPNNETTPHPSNENAPNPEDTTTPDAVQPSTLDLIHSATHALISRLRYTFNFATPTASTWRLADIYKSKPIHQALFIRSTTGAANRAPIDFGAASNAGIIMALQQKHREQRRGLVIGQVTLWKLDHHGLEFMLVRWRGEREFAWVKSFVYGNRDGVNGRG